MKWLRIASIGCSFFIVISLALARIHPFGDAGLHAGGQAEKPILESSSVPPAVRALLSAKCADCHSMQTRSPLYGQFAPASWLMERDISRGRKAVNLSLWDRYSADEQQTLAAKIAQKTRDHEMPLWQYRMIHWNTRITDADIQTLSSWARASSGSLVAQSDPAPVEGNASSGKALFEKRCTGCHALTQNHEGPKLQGVYGRTSGSVEDFAFSTALKHAHIVWDEKTLDRWLADPDAVVPGNEMDFLVFRPQERNDLIAFLKRVSGK